MMKIVCNSKIESNLEDDSIKEEEEYRSETGVEKSNCFIGKPGTKWNKNQPPCAVHTPQRNIMSFRAGPKEQIPTPFEDFKKCFTPNTTDIIVYQLYISVVAVV